MVKLQQTLENHEKLKPIIRTIMLCGRQCLPLKTYRDYDQFDISPILRKSGEISNNNEGNFRALLRAQIDSGDTILKQYLENYGKMR